VCLVSDQISSHCPTVAKLRSGSTSSPSQCPRAASAAARDRYPPRRNRRRLPSRAEGSSTLKYQHPCPRFISSGHRRPNFRPPSGLTHPHRLYTEPRPRIIHHLHSGPFDSTVVGSRPESNGQPACASSRWRRTRSCILRPVEPMGSRSRQVASPCPQASTTVTLGGRLCHAPAIRVVGSRIDVDHRFQRGDLVAEDQSGEVVEPDESKVETRRTPVGERSRSDS
jgi:hypothetical protein